MDEPNPAWNAGEVISYLKSLRDDTNIEGMGRFGIDTETALGISNTTLRAIGRKIKRNHERALELWASGIREARLLAAFTAEPKRITADIARAWAAEFNSWEIVDGVSDLFADAKLQNPLIVEFAADEREFVRRTAFAMIAWSAVHMKNEPDSTLLGWLPLIEEHASDPRNFVKKAVNWALRQIGKRSVACHGPALALAERLAASDDKTRRWNGRDAVKELAGPRVLEKLKIKV
jgi:3-methyladenine DNA glycosylase AlkD